MIVIDFSKALLLGQSKATNRLHKMGYFLDYQAAEGHCNTLSADHPVKSL